MTRNKWLCAAAPLVLPCLTGCGGSSSPAVNSPALVPRSVAATLSNGLIATLTEDRSTVSVGGTVTYTATLTNPTAQPVTYRPVVSGADAFSLPAVGLVVANSASQTVYPLNAAAQFVGTGAATTLAPGQSVSGTQAVGTSQIPGGAVAQGYAAAGQYAANARFSVLSGTSTDITQAVTATAGPLTVTAQ